MARHNSVNRHIPQRRWLPFLQARRCRCGYNLPCPVRTTLERQQYFQPVAQPMWGAAAAERPLMTPGQLHRSRGGAR
jgi:hypothetical protein